MKKVLSILLAVLMVASMFSVMSFAEEVEEIEKKVSTFYAGGAKAVTSVGGSNGRNDQKGFAFSCFDLEGKGGNRVIPAINKEVESGNFSAVEIVVVGNSTSAIEFEGLVGSEETPIIIKIKEGDAVSRPVFSSVDLEKNAPAIMVKDCENVTISGISVTKSIYSGIKVENCTNVAFKNVEFKEVGYTDYELPSVAEDGTETFPNMETADLLAKGAALLIGEGNTDITVDGCIFDQCRAGVVVDSTKLEVEEDPAEPAPAAEGEEGAEEPAAPVVTSGVSVLNCNFTNINEAAVILNSADDVLVSGGKATKVGTLAAAQDYDGTAVAVVKVNGSKDAVVEKMFSSFNEAFVNFADSTGKVRFNVSDNDGAGSIGAGVLVYNNTFVNASALDIATAKNNIFAMLIGEKVKVADGEANCYYWTSKGDKNSIKKNPKFANAFDGSTEGQDPIDNYRLSTISPCLGKGVKVEDDMGTTDFYGNEIGASINIGADQGAGAEATTEIVSDFVDFFNYIIAVIKNFLGIK
ncbi:MAG: hypothetical protein IJ279_04305 [Clostridia bacterium]|nr:hypothetical protein [Clostridia bacterium]